MLLLVVADVDKEDDVAVLGLGPEPDIAVAEGAAVAFEPLDAAAVVDVVVVVMFFLSTLFFFFVQMCDEWHRDDGRTDPNKMLQYYPCYCILVYYLLL